MTTRSAVQSAQPHKLPPAIVGSNPGGVAPKEVRASMHAQSTTLVHVGVRACARCTETKPLTEYSRRKTGSDARRNTCKVCEHATRKPATRWDLKIYDLRRRLGWAPRSRDLREALGEPTACYLCGDALSWSNVWLDHKTPVSRGGSNDPANLGWTHQRCNQMKYWRTVEEFAALIQRMNRTLNGGA